MIPADEVVDGVDDGVDDGGGGEDPVDADDGIEVGVGAVVRVCCRKSFWIAVG